MSKAKAPRVFVPLTKVDEEQRLVYGTITQEVVDQSGEVMDYESSKPNFEKWSNDIHEASGGLSKGNLRVMHGLTVAGKLTDLAFNDDDKSIEVCSKVVDDAEWTKVLEGCYTGFSVGGKYGKKWKDTVDGETITKFTAIPNEVSLVDNPCVKSATFSLVKADGAEEQIMFKAGGQPQSEEPKEDPNAPAQPQVSNEQVAAVATEMAKVANDGSTWIDHIEAAREQLIKAADEGEGGESDDSEEEGEEEPAAEGSEETDADDDEGDTDAKKVTPAGVMQKWTTSDGQLFEKKADAVAHEATLGKTEPTEADKLRARLEKAKNSEEGTEELSLFEDFDRLGKAYNALCTPFGDDGKPVLQKGMYTVERFARVLWDLGKLTKSIAAEGAKENNDSEDATVAADIKAAIATLGESFKVYVADQLTELLAGIDDEAYVCYYDYYYAAAHSDGEDQLAKDVCSILEGHKEESRERRETLTKSFGYVEAVLEHTEELSPPMQKRFDQLTASLAEMTKVATEAIETVETLTKRIDKIEDTPMPRAPKDGNIAFKEGDVSFMGKRFSNPDDLMNEVHDLIKTKGPDALAVELIKASQASGGQKLHLNR